MLHFKIEKPISKSLCLAVVLGASGCGGGGNDGPSTLVPNLTYPTTAFSPWEKTVIPAKLSGLSGQSPNCRVGPSPLPTGFSLDSKSCDLTIDDASPDKHTVSIWLSVDGYSGSNFQYYDITIDGPTLSYAAVSYSAAVDGIPWLKPLSTTAGTPILRNYTKVPGDILTYKVDGSLPLGVNLDPNTGQLSGTAQNSDKNTGQIYAELSRGGKSIKLRTSGSLTPTVPYVQYPSIVANLTDSTKVSIPQAYRTDLSDVLSFEAISSSEGGFDSCNGLPSPRNLKPSEVQLEPKTGAVRPLVNTVGVYCITVSTTVTRQGKSQKTTGNRVKFEIR
jgi:hypothetical protein